VGSTPSAVIPHPLEFEQQFNRLKEDVHTANEISSKHVPKWRDSPPVFSLSHDSFQDVPVRPLWRLIVDVFVRKEGEYHRRLSFKEFYTLFYKMQALVTEEGDAAAGAAAGAGAEAAADPHTPAGPPTAASAAVPLPTASQAVARPLGTSPQCVICMDRESQLVLPCAHSFCEACLWAWSVRSRTCPLCRARTRNQVRECFFLAESPTAKELTENIERYLDVTGKPVMSDPKKQSPQG